MTCWTHFSGSSHVNSILEVCFTSLEKESDKISMDHKRECWRPRSLHKKLPVNAAILLWEAFGLANKGRLTTALFRLVEASHDRRRLSHTLDTVPELGFCRLWVRSLCSPAQLAWGKYGTLFAWTAQTKTVSCSEKDFKSKATLLLQRSGATKHNLWSRMNGNLVRRSQTLVLESTQCHKMISQIGNGCSKNLFLIFLNSIILFLRVSDISEIATLAGPADSPGQYLQKSKLPTLLNIWGIVC